MSDEEDRKDRRIKKAFYTLREVMYFVGIAVMGVVAVNTFIITTRQSIARSTANSVALDSINNNLKSEIEELERNKASSATVMTELENHMRRIDNAMDRSQAARDLIEGRDGIAERIIRLEERVNRP